MKRTTTLAIAGLTLAFLLAVGVPTASAHVGISIGIPIPGVTFYAPAPPVYYSAPYYTDYYYPRTYYYPRYYAPGAYYGPGYGTVYFGHGGYGGHGYRHHRGHWRGHHH